MPELRGGDILNGDGGVGQRRVRPVRCRQVLVGVGGIRRLGMHGLLYRGILTRCRSELELDVLDVRGGHVLDGGGCGRRGDVRGLRGRDVL